ncbi:hypothetical protein [Natrarchaeobaculum sulfurireducens]|nr:hypothetical protein [Natrarchaeobaculum sulfurireducens]
MSGERTERSGSRAAGLRNRLESGIDRREFLRTAASGGFAVGLASVLGVDDFLAADDDEVTVVTAVVRSDPDDPFSLEERTRDVPAGWYEAVETALEVNELLARYAFTGYFGSAVVPGSYESESAAVSIGVSTEGSSIPEMVREVADGISINAETIVDIDNLEEGPDSTRPRLASSVDGGTAPSGVACETPSSMATLAPALYHPDGERSFFATAEHAFEAVSDPVGQETLLPVEGAESIELGTVERAHPVEDVAAIEPTGPLQPASWIDAPTTRRVRGQLTRYGIADLIARDEELEKVGALTGHTTGRIQGLDAVTCFTDEFCRRGQLRWGGEMDLTDGDSGSVSYHSDPEGDDEDVLVAGFNNARTWWPGQSYVWGVSAYTLTEEYGYHF